MNLDQDDPRLSAWVLGELSADEAAEVEACVAQDPELLASATQIQNLGLYLSSHLAPSAALRPVQRQAVYRAVRAPVPPIVTVNFATASSRKKPKSWGTILTAAAMLALGGFAYFKSVQPHTRTPQQAKADAQPEPEAPEPLTISPPQQAVAQEADRPKMVPAVVNQSVENKEAVSDSFAREGLSESSKLPPENLVASLSEVELPLVIGSASYGNVRDWIRDRNQLPPKDAVRVEELANAFPLPPQQETVAFAGAGLRVACISMSSPWVEGARLVGVQIANETKESRSVSWSFRPTHPARVRVLASTAGGDGKGTSVLPPNCRTLVLIELASSDADCGDLVVKSEGRSRRFAAQETQDGGMTQAGLVTAFGLWLRGEGVDDSRMSQILVSAGDDPDPSRADSRRLIRQALSLAADKRSKR